MMTTHFNRLSPAEAERLALLLEELGEAQQAIGKILRHGYESQNPFSATTDTNRDQLGDELGHVIHAIDRLSAARDVNILRIKRATQLKSAVGARWLHHQAAGPQQEDWGRDV